MKKQSVKKITFTALFAALIAVMTAFIKMPTGINEGYLHFGDSMIYLAGCLLGPWAALAAAIGGALADILAGARHGNHKGTQLGALHRCKPLLF